jgi:hypothetical protein
MKAFLIATPDLRKRRIECGSLKSRKGGRLKPSSVRSRETEIVMPI